LYSQFLANVVNDEAGAKRQLNRAVELEGEEDGTKTLTDSNNCIMIISGEKENMGEVLEVNDKTCEVFESPSEDIIGKKVNMFMARAISLVHNSYLTHYVEDKPANVSGISRKGITLKNAAGFVLEGDLQVREYANFTLEPSIAFFGLIKPQPLRMFCIVKRSDLVVWDISKPYFQFFNADLQKLRNYELKFTEEFPEFVPICEEVDKCLADKECYTFNTSRMHSGYETPLVVHVSPMKYLSHDYYHVLFQLQDDDTQAEIHKPDAKEERKPKKSQITEKSGGKGGFKSYRDSEDNSDNEDEESTRSAGSQNADAKAEIESASSARSGNLLRMGLFRTQSRLDNSLRYLLICILSLFALLCAMGICVQVLWTELTMNRYKATMDILVSPIQAGTMTATYSAFLFDHIFNQTLFNSTQERDLEEARIRDDLASYRLELDNFRSHFFTEMAYLTAEESNRLKNARVEIYNYEDVKAPITLMEAVHQYTVAVTMILNKNLSELHTNQGPLRFLTRNEHNNISDVWDNVCHTILSKQNDNSASVLTIEFTFMISAVSLVALITLTVFFPTVYMIFKQSADVYSMFEKLEQTNMREIYSQCIQRLKELEGIESTANNMELQDMMEVIASKRSHSETERPKGSKIRVNLISVLLNKLSFRILFIMVITIVYFLGYYIWWLTLYENLFHGIEYRVYHGIMRKYYTRRLTLDVLKYDTVSQAYRMNTDDIMQWEQHLWDTDHALYYGDAKVNITNDIRLLQGGPDILNENLCTLIQRNGIQVNSTTECSNFMGGILTQNSHEAVISFVSLSQDLRKSYDKNEPRAILEEKIKVLKELADYWFPASHLVYNKWIREVFTVAYTNASSLRQIGTVSYIIVCILSVIFIYLPMVRKMNRDLQQTRNLLMIIPPEVIENSKVLRDLVRSIALRMIQNQ
jgi:ABC-type multidrug transport system fused ATPase/permease subunit